jgi:hypothetical protein
MKECLSGRKVRLLSVVVSQNLMQLAAPFVQPEPLPLAFLEVALAFIAVIASTRAEL